MSDTVSIHDLRLLCHVGVPDDERRTAQPVALDLDLSVDLRAAGASDDVADTVDYGEVAQAVSRAATQHPVALLERLAVLVADAAFGVDDRVGAVTVTVRKLRPPVPLDVAATSVRIHRTRP